MITNFWIKIWPESSTQILKPKHETFCSSSAKSLKSPFAISKAKHDTENLSQRTGDRDGVSCPHPWSALIGSKDLPRFDYNTIKCYITIQIQIQIQIQILKQTTIQIHGVVMLGLIGGMQKSSKIQFIWLFSVKSALYWVQYQCVVQHCVLWRLHWLLRVSDLKSWRLNPCRHWSLVRWWIRSSTF